MSERWKAEAGVRLDGYNFQIPDPSRRAGLDSRPPSTSDFTSRIWMRRTCPIRATRFASASATRSRCRSQACWALDVSRAPYAAFDDIPSYDNSTGKPAEYCGPLGQPALHQLRRSALLADARLPFRQFDAGSAAGRRDLHQHRSLLGARVSRRLGDEDYTVLPARLQRRRADRADHRIQLSDRLARLRRRVNTQISGIQKATGIEALYTKELPLGVSMQIGATYISQFGNEPPGAFLQPAALALGVTYRSPDLSPFQLNAAFNWKNAHGWRINPVIYANSGFPYGCRLLHGRLLQRHPGNRSQH